MRMKAMALTAAGLCIVAAATLGIMYRGYILHGAQTNDGLASKLLCSGVYIQHRPLQRVYQEDVVGLTPFARITRVSQDESRHTVTASVFGLFPRTSLFRPGLGCTLMIGGEIHTMQAQAEDIGAVAISPRPGPWPQGDEVDLRAPIPDVDRAGLERAVDAAMSEDDTGNIRTRALLVVQSGRIVAERYAPGFDATTPFLSWSAAKTFTGALIGTLVSDGRLLLDQAAPVAEWHSVPNDPRARVLLRHMLNMTSGVRFDELSYEPGSQATVMLYESADMAAIAANEPLIYPPGTKWYYSSGNANLLSRIVRDQTGGTLKSYYDYSRGRLFDPLGMSSAIFEPDASGVFVGSSYLYATARDYARFGLMLLNHGRFDGRQLLSSDFVDFMLTPAKAAPNGMYGGQIWLNKGDSRSESPLFKDCPRDLFLAQGFAGQFIVVVPSKNAVLLRFGWSLGGSWFDINERFCPLLKTLPDAQSGRA
jgi:CubicO group peptidase (beta-lactamase class C family)